MVYLMDRSACASRSRAAANPQCQRRHVYVPCDGPECYSQLHAKVVGRAVAMSIVAFLRQLVEMSR